MSKPLSRRSMLAGSAAALSVPLASQATSLGGQPGPAAIENITLKDNAVVLIQGDSITDAGRARKNLEPNDHAALGRGYARMIGYHLLTRYAGKNLKIYNRGISGNKVPDLENRWDRDCFDLKPDVLSILIGVNDYWHTKAFGKKYKGTVDDYETGLKALLDRTRTKLPEVQMIVCEPFVVRAADGSTRPDWFPEFDERRARAKSVAESIGAVWVPFQSMFDEAIATGTATKAWSGDNIHVNSDGAALMAMRWLSETGLA